MVFGYFQMYSVDHLEYPEPASACRWCERIRLERIQQISQWASSYENFFREEQVQLVNVDSGSASEHWVSAQLGEFGHLHFFFRPMLFNSIIKLS